MSASPPRAEKKPVLLQRHGQTTADPYAWLKDPHWQAVLSDPSRLDPEIRQYLDAENAYTQAQLAPVKQVEEELFYELKGRLNEADATVPLSDGSWAYSHRFQQGKQYPVYLRHLLATDPPREEVTLDVAHLAQGHEFCRVVTVRHSPDHRYLAYSVDFNGSERYHIRVRDLSTGKDLPDQISDAGQGLAWGGDSRTIYYTALDEHQRATWVKRHSLGNAHDETLYTEPDPGFFLRLSSSSSGRFVQLSAYNHASSETHVLDTTLPDTVFRCIEPRAPGVLYEVAHHDEAFVILLHEGEAKDGLLLTAPVATPARAHWRELVPYRAGCLVEEILTFKNYLVRLVTEHATPRLIVRDLRSGAEHTVSFPEPAYFLTLTHGYEYETDILRFTYSSMATPEQTFDYHMANRERILRKQQLVPSGHDPAAYELLRINCRASDGEEIPVTLLRHKTKSKPGAPLLLYGYGSYGRSMPTSFSPHRFSLVDRGISYAIAHIRGGKDKGYAWYEGAKLLTKKRTFTDYLACAEHLAESGITARGRIIGHGASAGGMLIGAVANMAPTLFLALIADVPFVDVLNTMWDKDLPLTPPEWPEWGDPITSREAHDYIASYSPYENVLPQPYPHMLVLAGLTDPRVTYWEPAKWVARLRELKTDQNQLLLDVNMGAGHAGASGRFDVLRKVSRIYTFALNAASRAGSMP